MTRGCRHRLLSTSILLSVTIVAACKGGSSNVTAGATTTSPQATTAATAATTTTTAPSVGKITQIVATTLSVSGTDVKAAGRTLTAGDTLTTGATGESWFSLQKKVKECRVFPESKLQLSPGGDALVRWTQGSSVCTTTGSNGTAVFGVGTQVTVTTADPIFSVDISPDLVAIRVLSGSVKVVAGTSAAIGVGPNQQLTVPKGGAPSVGPFGVGEPAPRAQTAVTTYQKDAPKPDFSRPSPTGSTQLPKIYQRKTLIIGLDTNGLTASERSLVQSFFNFVARSWDLNPVAELRETTLDRLSSSLADRSLDVVVTPAPSSLKNVSTQPFFQAQDAQQRPWSLAVAPDAPFFKALQTFLVNAVNADVYGTQYRAAYPDAIVVPYTLLLGVLVGG